MARRARRAPIIATLAAVVVGVYLMRGGLPPPAMAAGSGPAIALGAASGVDVPARATTGSPDAYSGFHLHISAAISAGVALTAISGSATGGTLDTGGLFCTTQVPAPHEVNYGCVALAGQSTTAAGLLATITLHATGDGCLRVRLVDLPATDPEAVVADTYTIDQSTLSAQQNAVAISHVDVLIGTGVMADCAGLYAVGGIALAPHMPAAGDSARHPAYAAAAVALATIIAVGAAGWHAHRRRAP